MRPKKKILIVDANDTRRSLRSYMLYVRGFAVLPAATAEEALQAAIEFRPDLVVGCWPLGADPAGAEMNALFDALHSLDPGTRSMLVADKLVERPAALVADAVMLKGACSASEIHDRAKVLTAHKRGPRKFPPQSERGQTQAANVFPQHVVQDGQIARRIA